MTQIHNAQLQMNILLRPLLCKAEHTAENIFLSVLTLVDPLVTSLHLDIFLITHGGAIVHRGLTMNVMTLWAEFP